MKLTTALMIGVGAVCLVGCGPETATSLATQPHSADAGQTALAGSLRDSDSARGASGAHSRDGKWVRRLRALQQRLDDAQVVFADDFDRDDVGESWIVEQGTWQTCRVAGLKTEGVVGINGETYPDSFLWTRQSFEGDIALELEAECLSDPPNDINLVICGKSPNYPPPEVPLYLFGLGGWENTKTGVERAPDYKWKVLTALFTLKPRTSYQVQAARIGNSFYLFVDDRLVIEATDVDPLPATGQIALHVFHNRVRFSKLRVKRP